MLEHFLTYIFFRVNFLDLFIQPWLRSHLSGIVFWILFFPFFPRWNKQDGSSNWYWFGNNLLMRWCVAAWKSRDYCQWSRQSYDTQLCCVQRYGTFDRRLSQKSGRSIVARHYYTKRIYVATDSRVPISVAAIKISIFFFTTFSAQWPCSGEHDSIFSSSRFPSAAVNLFIEFIAISTTTQYGRK